MAKKDAKGFSRREFIKTAAAATALLSAGCSMGGGDLTAKDIKNKPRVVVIGGGLGGLSAAAICARNGFPTTLVERHDRPGGYATTFDRDGGRFNFEVSLHATSSTAGGPMREVLEAAGVLDQVHMAELPELCRIITPDYDMTWPQKKPQAVLNMICKQYPGEAEGIRGFWDEMMGVLSDAMKPFDRDSWWDTITFPLTHRHMWAVRKMTLGDLLDEYVKDTKARSTLATFWGYYGLPPYKLSAFYYCIATAAYFQFGGYYTKRRSQDLSNALADAIEASGGEVLLETEVQNILMKNNAVSGVKLADGKVLPAEVVISNASTPAVMNMLPKGAVSLGDGDVADYVAKLSTYKPALSSFVVWLGLEGDITEKIKDYEVFVSVGYDQKEAYDACLACDPDKAGVTATFYDNAYKGYSQPGTSTVALIMLSGYEPWKRFEKDYWAGDKAEYEKEKWRIADRLIEMTDQRICPGLKQMIKVKEAATPLTNIRYTQNPAGSIYGYEQSLDNSFMNRIGARTPFGGLYLASAWGGPGGGYQPCLMAGKDAFEAMVKDLLG